MRIAPFLLENWLRDSYFDAEVDIGSSGVRPFALGELRDLIDLRGDALDAVALRDSPTMGDGGLRRAIADRWGGGDPDRVLATHGSSEAIFLIMNGLLREGDEILVLDPCYQQLSSIAEAIGCRVRRLPLLFERGFQPDLDRARACVTPRTRMIVLNFPHNPTGAALDAAGQRAFVDLAASCGAYLVWDAAFADIVYGADGPPHPPVEYPRTLKLGTLSKAFGLPGLRVGWCLGDPDVLDRCSRLRDYVTLSLSPLVELIAQRTIERADVVLAARRPEVLQNLAELERWVDGHGDLVEWVRPRAGVCAFPRLKTVADVDALCADLIQRARTLLVPGTAFHMRGHVRLGFGGSHRELCEGLARLTAAIRSPQFLRPSSSTVAISVEVNV